MAGTITGETKMEGQRKAKKHIARRNQKRKKKREKTSPFMVGSYFTHGPFNVTCMQIVKSNNNGRFRIIITHQCNLPFYSKG
jgi:hypothetical protein